MTVIPRNKLPPDLWAPALSPTPLRFPCLSPIPHSYPAQCKEWSPSGYLKAAISQMHGRRVIHFSDCVFAHQSCCTLIHFGF